MVGFHVLWGKQCSKLIDILQEQSPAYPFPMVTFLTVRLQPPAIFCQHTMHLLACLHPHASMHACSHPNACILMMDGWMAGRQGGWVGGWVDT